MRLVLILIIFLLFGSLPLLAGELKEPLDWASLTFGLHRLEENPALALSPQQARNLIPLLEALKRTVRSSGSIKTGINQSLSKSQLSYLQSLAAQDRLDPKIFAAELTSKQPQTALIDLVEEKLIPKTKGQLFKAPKSRSNEMEINVLSDLLLGLLYLEKSSNLQLSPQQAENVCYLLKKIRPQISKEYNLARKMENILTPGQQKFLYSVQEELIKATDELPSNPVKGEDAWETQSELPLINHTLDFLRAKL